MSILRKPAAQAAHSLACTAAWAAEESTAPRSLSRFIHRRQLDDSRPRGFRRRREPGHVYFYDDSSGGSPGNFGTARLTTKGLLTFDSSSNYIWEFNTSPRGVDTVGGRRVTISGDAKFCPSRLGSGRFPIGQVLLVVENEGSDPINGTFSNLPDGSITRIGGNNFQANYEGGDGNDLTLTVAP